MASAMSIRAHLLLLSSCCVIATACSGPDVERIDEGKLCIYASMPDSPGMEGPTQDFVAGEPVFVSVSTEDCISACIENELAACTVTVDGEQLTVSSELSWNEPSGEQACIDLCGSLGAICASDPLPTGAYQVVHGSTQRTLSIPSNGVEPCGS